MPSITQLRATRQNYVTKRQRENAPNVQVRLLNAQIENPDFTNLSSRIFKMSSEFYFEVQYFNFH